MRFNHELWGEVVPDGPEFCHWGGRRPSLRLLKRLELSPGDLALEIGCGRGGTLGLMSGHATVCGTDLSYGAVAHARRKGLLVVQTDDFALPFANRVFTKVLSQDADAWMGDKAALARELRRVTAVGGLFILQTYARSLTMPADKIQQTSHILAKCGYTAYELSVAERLPQVLTSAGWVVASTTSLHSLYMSDNRRMIERLAHKRYELRARYGDADVCALESLLEAERPLFAQGFWTGLLITAHAL